MNQPINTAERDAPNPPTIAFLRDRNGVPGLRLFCTNHECRRYKTVTWEELGKPDDTPAIAIRFRCSKCGSKAVDTMPDWPKVPGAAQPWC